MFLLKPAPGCWEGRFRPGEKKGFDVGDGVLVAKQSQALPWSYSKLILGGVRQCFPEIETKIYFRGCGAPALVQRWFLSFCEEMNLKICLDRWTSEADLGRIVEESFGCGWQSD